MDGKTRDLISDNIQALKQLFPEAFVEDKIDFDKLQVLLGGSVDNDNEKYQFTWKGKLDALKLSLAQNTGTLRPDKESSKNWDSTENLYIEGDNLEVLRVLQDSYRGKVKMIYIDPPYNTGKDFVYKDDFHDNVSSYKEKMGENMKSNPETSGRYHTDWLNMIYPRLKLARNLLKDDGVIFISIDDNEAFNLKKICDEVFGEENFVDCIVWDKKASAKGVPPKNMMVNVHEYILAYQKTDLFKFVGEKRSEENDGFKNPDNDPRGPRRESNIKSTIKPIEESFSIFDPKTGKEYNNTWAFSKESLEKMIAENRILWKDTLPKQKEFMNEMTNENKAIKSSWGVFDAQSTTVFLKKLIPEVQFQNPKPINLMNYLIIVSSSENDTILDFFSGSGTTAHAVMQLNAEDGGNRKYIMVQLPETTDETSEAYKAGYENICEIGKERIRRAGEKILDDNKDKEGIDKLDIGFKVFKLDTTNLLKWDPDTKDLKGQLELMQNSIKDGRNNEDMVYEIMLKYGMDLTLPIQELNIDNKILYSIASNYMIICLESNIESNIIDQICQHKPSVVIFYDSCFANNVTKLNALHQLEKQNIQVRVI